MNLQSVGKLIGLVTKFIPGLREASAIAETISTVKEIVTEGAGLASDLKQPVQNIITALRNNPALTQAQLDELDKLEEQADAEFDEAAKASGVDEAKPPAAER